MKKVFLICLALFMTSCGKEAEVKGKTLSQWRQLAERLVAA